MLKLSETAKKLILSLAGLSVIAFGIGAILIGTGCFFTDNILYYLLGIVVGFLFNAVKVVMMSNTIEKAVDMSPKDASNYVRIQYSSRFFLTLIVLVASFKIPFIDASGVVIELLLLQFASYITNILLNKKQNKK